MKSWKHWIVSFVIVYHIICCLFPNAYILPSLMTPNKLCFGGIPFIKISFEKVQLPLSPLLGGEISIESWVFQQPGIGALQGESLQGGYPMGCGDVGFWQGKRRRFFLHQLSRQNIITGWKFNIAPENIPSQKESSLPTIVFQGLC